MEKTPKFSQINKLPEKQEEPPTKNGDFNHIKNKVGVETKNILKEQDKKSIEREFNFKLSDLPFREQSHFIQFIKNRGDKEIKFLQEFAKKHGIKGLRVVSLMDYYSGAGNKIIEIGNYPEVPSSLVFLKYNEILNAADSVEDYLKKYFFQTQNYDQKIIDSIKSNILKRGIDFLNDFVVIAPHMKERMTTIWDAQKEMDSLNMWLDKLKTEILLFKYSFKALKENSQKISLHDIAEINYVVDESVKLKNDSEIVNQLTEIYKNNYRNYPKEFSQPIIENFKQSFNNPDSLIFILNHKNKVAAFCRFEHHFDKNNKLEYIFFGSFNTNPDYQNAKIGETLLDASLNKEKEFAVPIRANCDPKSPITQKYIKWGFVASEIVDFRGIPSFKIEYDNNLRDNLKSIKLSKEEIIKTVGQRNKNEIIIQNWPVGEKPNFELLNQGYLLTQYFTDKDRLYAVFEKDPRLQEEYKEELKEAA